MIVAARNSSANEARMQRQRPHNNKCSLTKEELTRRHIFFFIQSRNDVPSKWIFDIPKSFPLFQCRFHINAFLVPCTTDQRLSTCKLNAPLVIVYKSQLHRAWIPIVPYAHHNCMCRIDNWKHHVSYNHYIACTRFTVDSMEYGLCLTTNNMGLTHACLKRTNGCENCWGIL